MRRRLYEERPPEAAHQLYPPEDQEHQVPVLRQVLRRQVQSKGKLVDRIKKLSLNNLLK